MKWELFRKFSSIFLIINLHWSATVEQDGVDVSLHIFLPNKKK